MRRQINGDLRPPGPILRRITCSAQHPGIDARDKAAGLGQRQKQARRHRAIQRMIPAQQRLVTTHLMRFRIDIGLPMQPQRILLQRLSQRGFHGAAITGRRAARLRALPRHHDPAPPLPLGLVQRLVRRIHQSARIQRIKRTMRDAHRQARHYVMPANHHRRGHLLHDPPPHLLRHRGVGKPRHHHGEFVATKPRRQITAAHDLIEPVAHFPQHHVAHRMPKPVINGLEPIQIGHKQRTGPAFGHASNRFPQPHIQQGPVAQPGQRIPRRRQPQRNGAAMQLDHRPHADGQALQPLARQRIHDARHAINDA